MPGSWRNTVALLRYYPSNIIHVVNKWFILKLLMISTGKHVLVVYVCRKLLFHNYYCCFWEKSGEIRNITWNNTNHVNVKDIMDLCFKGKRDEYNKHLYMRKVCVTVNQNDLTCCLETTRKPCAWKWLNNISIPNNHKENVIIVSLQYMYDTKHNFYEHVHKLQK